MPIQSLRIKGANLGGEFTEQIEPASGDLAGLELVLALLPLLRLSHG